MKVKDAMHKGATWVEPTTRLDEVAKLMRTHDVGAIPVGENDKLIGMVTDRDIALKGLLGGSGDVRHMTARDVMTKGIHCCSDTDDLTLAVARMQRHKVRRLPVIDKDKRMVGILSVGDVSHAAAPEVASTMIKSVSAHH